ncbi:hypothetical protein D3C78_1695510 [compost metagenome]
MHLEQARIKLTGIQAHQLGQCQTTLGQWLIECIEQAQPQRAQHATAAIVGGAATDGQDDSPRPGIEGGTDQLAGAIGTAATGITLAEAEQL